jgi:hypothetical protein
MALVFGSEEGVTLSPDHVYQFGGRDYNSVTTILKAAGFIEDGFYTSSGSTRGTAVHEMTEMIDEGMLKAAHAEEDLQGYLAAYEKFVDEHKVEWRYSELMFVDTHDGYGGTVDRFGMIDDDLWLIDIKTGQHQRHHGIQLEAYGRAFYEPHKRGILLLKPTGKYSLLTGHKTLGEFTSDVWPRLWDAALTLRWWAIL